MILMTFFIMGFLAHVFEDFFKMGFLPQSSLIYTQDVSVDTILCFLVFWHQHNMFLSITISRLLIKANHYP